MIKFCMKRQISLWFTAVVFTLLSEAYVQVPTIIRFLSMIGSCISSETIKVTSFNGKSDQNILFFDATKATMTNANTMKLIVSVPSAA